MNHDLGHYPRRRNFKAGHARSLRLQGPESENAALSPDRRPRSAGGQRHPPTASTTACPKRSREWIRTDGLTHLKIKLNGDDLRVGRGPRRQRRSRRRPDPGERGVAKWCYSLDFNEKLRQRRISAGIPRPRSRSGTRRLRADPVHRAADGPRPEGAPRQRHARGRQDSPGGHRRIADRPGKPAAGPGDGLHRRGPESVQGAEPIAAAGGGGPEVRHVPVRAGPDLPRRLAHSLRRPGGPRSRRRRHRIQRPAILPERQQAVGADVSRDLPHHRRHDGDRNPHRPRPQRPCLSP